MSTTLEDELEESAKLYDADARRAFLASDHAGIAYAGERAARLRQRAAWVRHWGERLVAYRDNPNLPVDNMIGPFTVSIFTTLTGPDIPVAAPSPETATEREDP